MAEVTNELTYEVLRGLQRGQSNIESVIGEIRNESQALRTHSLAVQTDIKNVYETTASIEARLDRLEKRLDHIGEPAE